MTNLDRRDMLRRGGAAALFAGLAGVLTQSAVVAEAGAALEAAPEAKKPGLTLRLLKENRVLEARCSELRAQYESLKRAFGDLSLLFESQGKAWQEIDQFNLEGMDELLEPWRQATQRGTSPAYLAMFTQEREREMRILRETVESHIRAADERAELAGRALEANSAKLRAARVRIKLQKEQLENQGIVIRRWREAQRVREGGVV